MSHLLHPGETGERLSNDESVYRLLKSLKDGKVIPEHFALSSKDEASPLCALSVWAESLTTPLQALELMTGNKREYTHYCSLQVQQVRSLTISELPQPALDVVWDRLCIEGTSQADTSPRCEGARGNYRSSTIFKHSKKQLQNLANKACGYG